MEDMFLRIAIAIEQASAAIIKNCETNNALIESIKRSHEANALASQSALRTNEANLSLAKLQMDRLKKPAHTGQLTEKE